MGEREGQLRHWVSQRCAEMGVTLAEGWVLETVSGDASFRCYFRVRQGGQSWIVVDAPPEKEDSRPFVAIARSWRAEGVRVPEVVADDLEQGFMLLSDLGDQLYLPRLATARTDTALADALYGAAIDELLKIQQTGAVAGWPLPPYDRALLQREMALFRDWFIQPLLGLELSPSEARRLEQTFDRVADVVLAQPVCPVHRDYHSRNLMWIDAGAPGVLDFQDAVQGAVTYDLVSLLRDAYIDWPIAQVQRWALVYRDRAVAAALLQPVDDATFLRWFDWMGVQRHLKVVGIFARLKLRDDKSGYLADIPRTFRYLLSVAAQYPELSEFVRWMQQRIVPAMQESGYFDLTSQRVSA